MSDLIKKLRELAASYAEKCNEASALKRENEELRQDLDMANACKEMWTDRHDYIEHIYKELLDQHDRNTNVVVRLAEELAALKTQSTEPVAEMKDLNTMLVMNAEIASLKQQLAEKQRENEELRRSLGAQCESADKLFDELAALKAQSTPASVWLWRNKITFCFFATKELAMQMNSGGLSTWVEPVEVPVIGNTTPPTATALLENLGDWVYKRMQQANSDYHNHGDDTAEVYATLKMVLSKIESMIEGENHGRHE